jgi:hypothetical protein
MAIQIDNRKQLCRETGMGQAYVPEDSDYVVFLRTGPPAPGIETARQDPVLP